MVLLHLHSHVYRSATVAGKDMLAIDAGAGPGLLSSTAQLCQPWLWHWEWIWRLHCWKSSWHELCSKGEEKTKKQKTSGSWDMMLWHKVGHCILHSYAWTCLVNRFSILASLSLRVTVMDGGRKWYTVPVKSFESKLSMHFLIQRNGKVYQSFWLVRYMQRSLKNFIHPNM